MTYLKEVGLAMPYRHIGTALGTNQLDDDNTLHDCATPANLRSDRALGYCCTGVDGMTRF